jgi:ABC-type transport system substrate-binding protein
MLTLLLASVPLFAFSVERVAMFVPRARAWEYNDGRPSDTLFEASGPRADRMLIKFCSDSEVMQSALEGGQVDLTDSYLTQDQYDSYTRTPFNDSINVIPSGSGGGFYILDINNNNNQFLGNPPDSSCPNPVYPNPCSVLGMRKAIAYLCDRNYIINNITGPLSRPLYTLLLPDSKNYIDPEIRPGGLREDLCYLYSRTIASALLDSSGFMQRDVEGWRIWNATGQRVVLKFWIRNTAPRKAVGDFLANELEAVGIKVQRIYYPVAGINEDPVTTKNFNLITGGWLRSFDPNDLILWHGDYYWHPGYCYNYACCNDTVYNAAVDAILNAATFEEAVAPAYLAQERFAEMALSVPLWYTFNYQAASRRYVGTPSVPDEEDSWEGKYWEGLTQRDLSYGVDNPITLMNMHPQNNAKGDGSHMTIRYGFSVPILNSLNPLYPGWASDTKVLDLMYESLFKIDPYNINNLVPWLAKTYKIDTYVHPAYGECTRIKVTLRPDIYWSDGTPMTAADVYFSLKEVNEILKQRGLDRIWWDYEQMAFKTLDPYNFEILFFAKNVWASWPLLTSRILPRHIWEPICRTWNANDITGFAPDPNLIASGPWRLKQYVPHSQVELVRNDAGSTVQTNLPGSLPITSPHGYFKAMPLEVDIHGDGYKTKFAPNPIHIWGPDSFRMNINFTATLLKLSYESGLMVDEYIFIDDVLQPGYPIINISLASMSPDVEHFNITYGPSKHYIKIAAFIKEPEPWKGKWVNETLYLWITIREDISGSTLYDEIGFSTYPYKQMWPSSDIKVDVTEVAEVCSCFGAIPGFRPGMWDPLCDIDDDYKVDVTDIATVVSRFGWHG